MTDAGKEWAQKFDEKNKQAEQEMKEKAETKAKANKIISLMAKGTSKVRLAKKSLEKAAQEQEKEKKNNEATKIQTVMRQRLAEKKVQEKRNAKINFPEAVDYNQTTEDKTVQINNNFNKVLELLKDLENESGSNWATSLGEKGKQLLDLARPYITVSTKRMDKIRQKIGEEVAKRESKNKT